MSSNGPSATPDYRRGTGFLEYAERRVCSACPVDSGLCPSCDTFWIVRRDGKKFGVPPPASFDLRVEEAQRLVDGGLDMWPDSVRRAATA